MGKIIREVLEKAESGELLSILYGISFVLNYPLVFHLLDSLIFDLIVPLFCRPVLMLDYQSFYSFSLFDCRNDLSLDYG